MGLLGLLSLRMGVFYSLELVFYFTSYTKNKNGYLAK